MTLLGLALIFLLLLASSFLALSEMSLVAFSKLRLRHLVQRGVRNALPLQKLIGRLDEVITSLVVANNFVNTAISTLGAVLCVAWLGPGKGVLLATFLLGTIIIVLGEITPKVLAIRRADRMALALIPVLVPLMRLLRPISRGFSLLSNRLLKAAGVEPGPRSPLVTEEEIKIMIELGKEQGVLGEEERNLLHRIFEFGDLKVEDVMIRRSEMVCAHAGATHEEVLTLLTEEGHSRIPVYRDDPTRIIGVIHAQEMLHLWREGWLIVLQDLVHPPYEVRADQRVSDILREFQRRKVQIAIVVDGEGRALGMATLEDLVEEIVGEIDGT
jgi:putative hemolysin